MHGGLVACLRVLQSCMCFPAAGVSAGGVPAAVWPAVRLDVSCMYGGAHRAHRLQGCCRCSVLRCVLGCVQGQLVALQRVLQSCMGEVLGVPSIFRIRLAQQQQSTSSQHMAEPYF